jgi:hypothetical protein
VVGEVTGASAARSLHTYRLRLARRQRSEASTKRGDSKIVSR